jgi:Tol biopolymer transport system component
MKQPVRVTYSDGFDGLPVPSPDGKQLAWTSSRSSAGAGQIFLAQWNHDKALAALKNALPRQPTEK